MPFYNELDNLSNFLISFKRNLRNDFGVFAKGYAKSASKLAVDLLSRNRFGDYEAYPIVFLYRHSLELYLKNIIYRSVLLSAFKNVENIDHRLYNTHDLNLLSEKATQILLNLFPDYELESAKKIIQISSEFSEIDPNSFSYRYPIDRDGNASTKPNQIVNLEAFHKTMALLMNDLENIDFGIDVETHNAQELYEILEELVNDLENIDFVIDVETDRAQESYEISEGLVIIEPMKIQNSENAFIFGFP